MKKFNPMFSVMQQELQRKKVRLSRNYAQGLAALLHIDPHGKQLISLVGKGDESSNEEALSHWVFQRLEQIVGQEPMTKNSAEAFRQALVCELMDFQA